MVGPLGRILAQVIVPVVAVLARALPAAYAQALQNARKSGGAAAADAAANAPIFGKKVMSQQEAMQILNISDQKALTPEAIKQQFERFMAANDVKNGGSFYLQSKIYRAHEALEQYMKEQEQEQNAQQSTQKDEPDQQTTQHNQTKE